MTQRGSSYKDAGVDLAAAEETVREITDIVADTYTPGVISGIGAFGGLFALPTGYDEPVLVASTDGVGTKTVIAARAGRHGLIGSDLVNHCVNDVLVQGATPLFFLDYVAASRLEPSTVTEVVKGVASACRAAGMALLGGETAEMPGVYLPGQLDVAGTIVGIVERSQVVDGSGVREGDVLLAFESGGLQTNGFSLARYLLADHLDALLPGDPEGRSVQDALLAPHRSFLGAVRPLLGTGLIRGMAHVTGGGLPGNLPRSLPQGLGAVVERGSWPEPPIFGELVRRGNLSDEDAFAALNMGVGFVLIVRPAEEDAVRSRLGGELELHGIGRVVGSPGVRIV